MSGRHTIHTLCEFIQSRWESDLPDKVIEALRPLQGKLITSRLLDRLPGGKDQWRMARNYGWTEIETVEYRQSHGNKGVRLILARSESSVPLDITIVESENPAYFAGRRERNHARMEARNTREKLEALAAVMNRIERLKRELDTARTEFDALTEHGEVFNPDRYALERVIGLRDDKTS